MYVVAQHLLFGLERFQSALSRCPDLSTSTELLIGENVSMAHLIADVLYHIPSRHEGGGSVLRACGCVTFAVLVDI